MKRLPIDSALLGGHAVAPWRVMFLTEEITPFILFFTLQPLIGMAVSVVRARQEGRSPELWGKALIVITVLTLGRFVVWTWQGGPFRGKARGGYIADAEGIGRVIEGRDFRATVKGKWSSWDDVKFLVTERGRLHVYTTEGEIWELPIEIADDVFASAPAEVVRRRL